MGDESENASGAVGDSLRGTSSHAGTNSCPGARCLVALCTFNERENLPTMVQQVHDALPAAEILIVDDDSPDGSGCWAEQQATQLPYLTAIVRRRARGLGGALRTAIEFALQGDYDWLLNLDADHSHDPYDLPRLLAAAKDGEQTLDCVVGTRYGAGGQIAGWTAGRRVMSRMVNRFATGVLRLPVSDCSGSLRCYRVAALAALETTTLRSNGYAIFEELLLRLRKQGATFGEVPITFHERQAGESKLTFSEAGKAALQIMRLALH